MPFKHAEKWLLLLIPMIVIAFWPGYFGQMGDVPFAIHAHGITAMAWITLTLVQTWSIRLKRYALHRATGLATFVVVPAFAGAGLLAMQRGAALGVAHADPFHGAYGIRLGLEDLIMVVTLTTLVCFALANRRRVHVHAAAMLATVILVLPPITARIFPAIPGFPGKDVTGIPMFELAFQLGEFLSIPIALWLARRPGAKGPFVAVAIACAVQMLTFMIGGNAILDGVGNALSAMPAIPVALAGVVVAAVALALSWRGPLLPAARVAPSR